MLLAVFTAQRSLNKQLSQALWNHLWQLFACWLLATLIKLSARWDILFLHSAVTEEGRPKISELATVPIQPSQWYTLGLAFGVEEEVLDRIEVEQAHKLAKCKRAMFRKWLELNPTPSWNNVVEAYPALVSRKQQIGLEWSSSLRSLLSHMTTPCWW